MYRDFTIKINNYQKISHDANNNNFVNVNLQNIMTRFIGNKLSLW